MNFLETISQTSLVRWAAESDWGYPIVLTAHAIGMALVVGILLMFDLRVLGLGKRIPFDAIRSYFRVAWLGLVINVCSGTLLFFINYTAFLHNTAFLTKISLLTVAGIGTWVLAREVSDTSGITSDPVTPAKAGVHAANALNKMDSRVRGNDEDLESSPMSEPLVSGVISDTSRRTQVIAWVCVALWLGAIVAGRIVGYTSVPE